MSNWLLNRSTWAVVGAVALLAWAHITITSYGEDQYQAGLDACRSLQFEQQLKQDAAKSKEYASILAAALARRTTERDQARRLADELQHREPEIVTHEIIKVVEAGPCQRVGPDVLRVLNDAVGTEPDNQ